MMKTIIFYVLLFTSVLGIVSMPNMFTVALTVLSVTGIYRLVSRMSLAEFYEVTGANFYNRMLNTNDFTEE